MTDRSPNDSERRSVHSVRGAYGTSRVLETYRYVRQLEAALESSRAHHRNPRDRRADDTEATP